MSPFFALLDLCFYMAGLYFGIRFTGFLSFSHLIATKVFIEGESTRSGVRDGLKR